MSTMDEVKRINVELYTKENGSLMSQCNFQPGATPKDIRDYCMQFDDWDYVIGDYIGEYGLVLERFMFYRDTTDIDENLPF